MVRRIVSGLSPILMVLLISSAAFGAALMTFTGEQEAHRHCPADTIVWLNLPTGVYHLKGERWYGRTKSGAY
ncbi:MAG: hypothetical protein ACREFH_07865, partial [Stellaceae bacterium]